MKLLGVVVVGVTLLLATACADPLQTARIRGSLTGQATLCDRATIEELASNPWQYDQRRVCVEGYIGHMVAYGEDNPELFSTVEEARTRRSEWYITIGLRFTQPVQEYLAAQSGRRIVISGVFSFDPRCWPMEGELTPRYQCAPPSPMRLRQVSMARAD